MPNVLWFLIVKCDDLLFFFVIYDRKLNTETAIVKT